RSSRQAPPSGCYHAATALQPPQRIIRATQSKHQPQRGATPRPQTRSKSMSNTIQAQHPAVVLRSNYQHLRALLTAAIIAIVGLTVAVVVLATSHSAGTITNPAAQVNRTAVHANPSPPIGPNPDQQ